MNKHLITISMILILLILVIALFMSNQTEQNDQSLTSNSQAHETTDHDDHSEHSDNTGSHGGWLFKADPFSIEVLLFEKGTTSEFRIYTYVNHQIITPESVDVSMTIKRLGQAVQEITFKTENDYLFSQQKINEPHSFQMNLSARYQDKTATWEHDQFEGRILMDENTLQRSGVGVSTAGAVTLIENTELPGEIRFNQDHLAHVVSSLSGIVTDNRKRLGELVEKGELLAVIQSQELVTLKSDYLAAKERLALANKLFKREKQLRNEGISAEQDFLNSQTRLSEAKINLQQSQFVLIALGIDLSTISALDDFSHFEVRAPLTGTIINKHVSQGESITSERTLFVIADLSDVWVEFTVYPQHLANVHVDQAVTVEIDSLKQNVTGNVAWIGPLIGEKTRSAKAYISLKNPDRNLRPGQFVKVHVKSEEYEIPVAVKHSAIQSLNDQNIIFIHVENTFEMRPVELGRRDEEWVEIITGLDVGMEYVSKNSFLFKAELGKNSAGHAH